MRQKGIGMYAVEILEMAVEARALRTTGERDSCTGSSAGAAVAFQPKRDPCIAATDRESGGASITRADFRPVRNQREFAVAGGE